MAEPFIIINGKKFPQPQYEPTLEIATTVDSGRNALNEVVAQRVGRDAIKFTNLTWPVLDAQTWAELLQEFEKFRLEVRMVDPVHNTWQTILMYPGNRTMTVFKIDEETCLPVLYKDCKCNIIDMAIIG